jgi:hypothetical protein
VDDPRERMDRIVITEEAGKAVISRRTASGVPLDSACGRHGGDG